MERLTIKELHLVRNQAKANQKLCDLEDIEQELGIDLITLFNAIKKWLKYIRIGVDFYKGYCCGIVALALENKEMCIIYTTQNREECKQLEIIRKALTREELEK